AWHETTLESDPTVHGTNGSPLSLSVAASLPSISGPVTQSQIVARVHVTHDPAGAATVEDHDTALMSWDGTTLTPHSFSTTIAQAGNTTVSYTGTRQIETVTKIEVMNGINGATTPIREKNTTTSGLAGLGLLTVSLSDLTSAQTALDALDVA